MHSEDSRIATLCTSSNLLKETSIGKATVSVLKMKTHGWDLLQRVSLCVSQVSGRRSRQVLEAEPVEGVWSVWGEWSACSQTCNVGVSQRSRKCLPPPPPQSPPLSHSPHTWAGFLPGGIGGPVASPVRPFYPPRYPGQHPPYQPPPANHSPGLSLFRNPPTGNGGAAQTHPSPPFHLAEFPPNNQDPASVYRSPYLSNARSHGYNQPSRIIRRPTNPGAARAIGGGSRRSVSNSQEGTSARRWVQQLGIYTLCLFLCKLSNTSWSQCLN